MTLSVLMRPLIQAPLWVQPPSACPKRTFTFKPEALLKQRRTRVPEPAPEPVPVAVVEDEEVEEVKESLSNSVDVSVELARHTFMLPPRRSMMRLVKFASIT
jgi:hypothetical protein